jgi:hypothetical protein
VVLEVEDILLEACWEAVAVLEVEDILEARWALVLGLAGRRVVRVVGSLGGAVGGGVGFRRERVVMGKGGCDV